MLWSHLCWALGIFAVLEWRRPSASQLAVAEAELLRVEVQQLRLLVQQLEGGCSGCDWELFLWRWVARVLGVALVLCLVFVFTPKIRSPKLKLELPAPEFAPVSESASDSSRSPKGAASAAVVVKSGPKWPSDLKRRNHGSDPGHSGSASIGVVPQ